MFFALYKASSSGSAFLDTDYSFDDVDDPMIMARTEAVPPEFMRWFRLSLLPGKIEDSIRNDIWYLLSPRVITILKRARNAGDLNIVPLPTEFQIKHRELTGYCALGVRRQLECINRAASDIRWSKRAPERWADDVYDVVIAQDSVPSDCDVFLLREWPVAPILREGIAQRLRDLNITGLSLQPFRAST